jgi:prepilin-type N-terminal cleavage/methylation domain-containing protein
MKPKMMPRCLGFSLVEVLIVITLVAVLISLLVPAIGQARNAARSSACKSKQRQIGVAFSHYTADNKGYYPYANPYYALGETSGTERPYTWRIQPYLGEYTRTSVPSALVCPSNPWTVVSPGINRIMPVTTYGLNDSTFPKTGAANPGLVISEGMTKANRLIMPGGTLLVGETPIGLAAATGYGRGFDEGQVVEPTSFRTDNVAYSGPAPVGYWYTPEIAGRPTPSPGHPTVRVNHNVGWNSLMADGSVIYHKKSDLQRLAQQATNLTANSEGMMFWKNSR